MTALPLHQYRYRRDGGGEKGGHKIVVAAQGQRHERDDRADDKAQAERRADQPKPLRARLIRCAIGDHGLRSGDVAAGYAVDDPRYE
jgi:hypothetical protein